MASVDDPPRLWKTVIRRLESSEEFRAVEDVQRDAWGLGTEPPVPATILRAFQDNGGLLLGAFDGPRMVGFTMGFLGRERGATFHYSHMTAVRRAAQNRHLGFELKCRQREEVLASGLEEIRWTFDPLQSKNARLNVRRLGGRSSLYLPRYYGPMSDAINAGLETDRLLLRWPIASRRVGERLGRPVPDAEADAALWRRSRALLESSVRPNGVRVPGRALSPEGPSVHLEIPFDLSRMRSADPDAVRRWRTVTRAAFEDAFRSGYVVDDFLVREIDGERRSFYVLTLGEANDAT